MSAIILGFVLGIRHALDADHVVAVTALVTRERSVAQAARIGAWWGLGHSVTILLVGGAIVLFRIAIPARLALAFEFCVALMLIGIGVVTMLRARDERHGANRSPAMRPLLVGTVHGLAGSAALALLVLSLIDRPLDGVMYLILFGAGTMTGMVAVTALIAAPTVAAAGLPTPRAFGRYVRAGAGALSLALGLLIAHDVGVRHQLFGRSPSQLAE
jgi:high-affinity nickel-transport protein